MWERKTRQPRSAESTGAGAALRAPARTGTALAVQRALGNQTLQRIRAEDAPPRPYRSNFPGESPAERFMHDRAGRGEPLPDATRAELEPRLGRDFRDVRVHHGAHADAAARSVDALAFTVGRDVVFRAGQYAPNSRAGRRLLAHELVHVMQQSAPAASGPSHTLHRVPSPTLQRQVTPATPQPQVIPNASGDQARWRVRVDRAVRTMFGLRGAGLTSGRVHFVGQTEFARRFPAASLEEDLLSIFLDFDPHGILHYNRNHLGVAPRLATLRTFVQDGIRNGVFIGQTGEYDVTTGRPFPPQRFTPRQLVAEFIAGITEISGPRASREITVQAPGFVDTLVHEACHFYVSGRFRDMVNARTDRDNWIGDARIGQILMEGFAEYFAREVMSAHARDFGVLSAHAYQAEVDQVWRLVMTLGEASVRQAYFHGDRAQIRRVAAAVDEYKQTDEDLLIPGSVIDYRLRQQAAAAGGAHGAAPRTP